MYFLPRDPAHESADIEMPRTRVLTTRGCEFPYSPTFWEGNLQMGNSPVFRGIWGILFRFSFFLFVCSFFLLSVTVVRSIPSPCFLVPGLTFAYERHC